LKYRRFKALSSIERKGCSNCRSQNYIQATADFQQWTVTGTTNCSARGVVTYNVAPATNTPRQFFRLAVK
jgi:hypothetical protein